MSTKDISREMSSSLWSIATKSKRLGEIEMTNSIADSSLRKAAIVAGLGLLVMSIFAIFAQFSVIQGLIVPGDAAATSNNIMANEMLFRLGIVSFMIVIICDVIVAWGLYVLLKPVNKNLSLLTAWFRLAYAAIFAVALANLFYALQLLSGADYLAAFEPNQLQAQVMLSLDAFHAGWTIGLVIFGLHLALLGYLAFKSGYIPKILGILLIIAGFGYFINSFIFFLVPNYEAIISLFTFIGELLFMFWLLWKGVKGFDKN